MNWSELALAFVGSGLVGGIVGSFANHLLNIRFVRESELLSKKREIFDEVAQDMRIFVAGALVDGVAKERFLKNYSRLWLWAPDAVLSALNEYIELNRRQSAGEHVEQQELKKAYTGALVAMRREIGFSGTSLSAKDYQFVKF